MVKNNSSIRRAAVGVGNWLIKRSMPVEGRLSSPELSSIFGGGSGSESGVQITEHSSMSISGVYRAVDLMSNLFAGAPWPVYRLLPGGAVEETVTHPLSMLLNMRANIDTSAFDFKKSLMIHALVWGNGIARIVRNGQGRPVELWQIEPERAELWRHTDGSLWVKIDPPNGVHSDADFVPYKDIIHIKGLSHNGIIGSSLIGYARESLGLTKAGELYNSRFFKNDGTSGAVVEIPGNPDDEIVKKMRLAIEDWRTGTNQHKILALRGGMKLGKSSTSPDDAQAIETRKFQLEEVARWFGVPLHLIGNLDHATFSNIENLALQFAHFGMRPWFTRAVQEVDYKCLTPRERMQYQSRIPIDSIVPIDSKTRSENNSRDVAAGITSPDEVRLERGMNPRPDGLGDMYMVPLNMVPSSQVAPNEDGQGGPDSDAQPAVPDADPIRAFLPVIVDTASRLADAEMAARERAWWASDHGKRAEWVQKHRKRAIDAFTPVAEAMGITGGVGMIGDAVAGSIEERTGSRDESINTIADIARSVLIGQTLETTDGK